MSRPNPSPQPPPPEGEGEKRTGGVPFWPPLSLRGRGLGGGGRRVPFPAVNAYLVGEPGGQWAVVDTGTPGSGERIREVAEARYGKTSRPEAIYLTHGHNDHSGSARELAAYWDVPIYAHPME